MKSINVDSYHDQQADCNGLCDITDVVAIEKDYMRCVTCPFCKETVDAILTKSTIACPKCKVVVNR